MPRVTVILTDEELQDVRIRAGDIPLTRWFKALAFSHKVRTGHLDITVTKDYKGEGPPRFSAAPVTLKPPPRFKRTALAFNKEEFTKDSPLKVIIGGEEVVFCGGEEVVFCEHGATAYNCKKWGCKFYEIANGRKS